ncbi:MAG: chemotaxis protein CheB, partial [bacterium]|nr:chemotaxis protein CheB [bacterium]
EVREAKDGDEVAVGRVLIAPGGRQMEVKRKAGGLVVHVHDGPPVNECRPAMAVLMDSVGEPYKGDVATGIMTGMGHDGMEGVARLKEKGAYCIAQDEATCVVYGMPRTVVEAGNADEVLPLDQIAPRMLAWATGVEGGAVS